MVKKQKIKNKKTFLNAKFLLFFALLIGLFCIGFCIHKINAKKTEYRQNVAVITLRPLKNNVKTTKQKSAEKTSKETAKENIYYMAVIVDDMGISDKRTKDIISIEAPLTSSFLTYGKNLDGLAKSAVLSGHEIMMHTPMEPKVKADLAPDTLKISMTNDEIKDGFLNMLQKFENIHVKGINNHMGSLFTESAPKLDVIMHVLKEKDMYFLDSKTTPHSVGKNIAELENVNYIERDVFLDNQNDYEYILKQLKQAEEIAEKQGYAVAICHPKSETYKALKDWVKTLGSKNIELVHLSDLIKKIQETKKSS